MTDGGTTLDAGVGVAGVPRNIVTGAIEIAARMVLPM
jgi:hypothetical protein